MNWAAATITTVVQACNVRVTTAKSADWPADLSTLDLSKYLVDTPEEDHWWALLLLTASAVLPTLPTVVEQTVEEPPEDGTLMHHVITSSCSNFFQTQ